MSIAVAAPPRVGFLGVGWIGRARMQALAAQHLVDAVAVADADPGASAQAAAAVPGVRPVADLDALLDARLDGIVIATPSAMHAEQAIAALERGVAVFCQKPLARNAAEARAVLSAARRADVLLGVDLSYRHLQATTAARALVRSGELGDVYAVDLVFHNAYGPDKPWFAARSLSGGGCLIDLGTHLVDLALWLTGTRDAEVEAARTLRAGRPLSAGGDQVEDYAVAQLRAGGGITVRLACSWHLSVGADCAIECTVYGTDGAVSVRNVDGSFYDFTADHHRGTSTRRLAEPPDDWGPRAIGAWAAALRAGRRFDAEAERAADVAAILDAIYGAAA